MFTKVVNRKSNRARKARIYQINDAWQDHPWANWFEKSLENFTDDAPSLDPNDYDFIQIIPITHYKQYHHGNAGAQGFRHNATGWTFPDWCRQTSGCPEMWARSRRHQLNIADDSPVWDYIVSW